MSDKNYKSYETLTGETVEVGYLIPPDSTYADTMKTFKCLGCTFTDGQIVGSTEDCIDIGTHCRGNLFQGFDLWAKGKYCITLKSNSNGNMFRDFHLQEHGSVCDIQQGNWSDQDNRSNENNVYENWSTEDRRPVTWSYRFGSGRPVFINTVNKHLWLLSLGITIYFYLKLIGRKLKLV